VCFYKALEVNWLRKYPSCTLPLCVFVVREGALLVLSVVCVRCTMGALYNWSIQLHAINRE